MVQNRRTRVNMADVARESGVSLSTVSMVLSDKPGLPVETRQRVLNAVRALGYNPRRPTGQTGILRTVGLIIKSQFNDIPRSDQFYAQVVAGIEAACRQRNLNLLYAAMSADDFNRPLEIPSLIENGGADGVLLVGAQIDADMVKVIDQRNLPVVLVDAYSEIDKFDAVVSDNVGGTRQATQYLIDNGHRKIGFVGGADSTYPSFAERRNGYLKALHDNQITDAFFADCHNRREETIDATRALLLAHPEVTALVGVNDWIATTAMYAANELGRRVGDDLSIIGYDDILLAENVIPPLTTMRVDKVIMGQSAVQLLVNRVEQPESGRVTVVIHPDLVERNSVTAVPAGIALPIKGLPVQG